MEETLLLLQVQTNKKSNTTTRTTTTTTTTMGAAQILRSSIHTFLTNFPHFTSTPTLLSLPFSVSLLLLLPTCLSPHLLPHIHLRLTSVFSAAGFPSTSPLFNLLPLKLAQTLVSSISTLPFSLTFLLLSKSAVIHSFSHHNHNHSHPPPFFHLLLTQLCNSLVLLAAHSTSFTLLSLAFTAAAASSTSSATSLLHHLVPVAGAVLYSIVVAKAVLVCNLGLIVSGSERLGGFLPILKACAMLRGRRTLTALWLALVTNIAMAAVEFLFSYRVVDSGRLSSSWVVAGEGVLIGYMYSVLIVLDVIIGCIFYQNCKLEDKEDEEDDAEEEAEDDEQDESIMYRDYASDEAKLRALEQGIAF